MSYDFSSENAFFNNIDISRASKIYSKFEIFIKTKKIVGEILEFGVFKGNSLSRLILMRDIHTPTKKIYGFDTFKTIKPNLTDIDFNKYNMFINDSGSSQPSKKELELSLKKRNMYENVLLIKGDVKNTFPHKEIKKVSFVLLDL